ncbi:MAG: HU family DNA-binding protein [Desulfarculales bacterium]|jgi:DNA-binding protein HU-beta|nr:HU family DNA-binding protein [Desulfarculales bacterium]
MAAGRKDLIKQVASACGVTQKVCGDILHVYFEGMAEELATGNDVLLFGLGRLKIKQIAARQGRNPKTGENVTIPAKSKVSFATSKALNERLNPDNKKGK